MIAFEGTAPGEVSVMEDADEFGVVGDPEAHCAERPACAFQADHGKKRADAHVLDSS
jgi:hypothetical protein